MISSIEIKNLLSFSSQMPAFQLSSLNIFVGANGSGKSNFLEVFALLKSLTIPAQAQGSTSDLLARGGGIQEWIHKTSHDEPVLLRVRFDTRIDKLTYSFSFTNEGRFIRILSEKIVNDSPNNAILYDLNNGKPILVKKSFDTQQIVFDRFDTNNSVLSQYKDPNNYFEMSEITAMYESIRLYRNWQFGRDSILRQPQRADLRSHSLEEDFSNFALVLSRLFKQPMTKKAIIEAFKEVYDGITDIQIDVGGANAEIFIFEGNLAIPAIRLSDGTLRYLVLVTLLLDPNPPPLICLEEPELGMHPDLIKNIANLLKDAATRTQLIVTTHSELLVDAFSDQPETIVVCEKEDGVTTLKRLEPERLEAWLEDYRLGEVWLRGEIGGVRW